MIVIPPGPYKIELFSATARQAWRAADPRGHKRLMVIVASGLVLGEGTASILTASLRAALGS